MALVCHLTVWSVACCLCGVSPGLSGLLSPTTYTNLPRGVNECVNVSAWSPGMNWDPIQDESQFPQCSMDKLTATHTRRKCSQKMNEFTDFLSVLLLNPPPRPPRLYTSLALW